MYPPRRLTDPFGPGRDCRAGVPNSLPLLIQNLQPDPRSRHPLRLGTHGVPQGPPRGSSPSPSPSIVNPWPFPTPVTGDDPTTHVSGTDPDEWFPRKRVGLVRQRAPVPAPLPSRPPLRGVAYRRVEGPVEGTRFSDEKTKENVNGSSSRSSPLIDEKEFGISPTPTPETPDTRLPLSSGRRVLPPYTSPGTRTPGLSETSHRKQERPDCTKVTLTQPPPRPHKQPPGTKLNVEIPGGSGLPN